MVLEISPQYAEKISFLGQTQDPKRMLRFQEEQHLDQSSKFSSYNFLATMDLKLKFQSPNNPERTSWVVICKGKSLFVNELHVPDPGRNLTSSELLSEQAIAKEGELCSSEMEQSTEETRARPFRTPPGPACHTKGIFSLKERKWKSILACPSFKGKSLSTAISKLVMRLVRHHDQEEREPDGRGHGNTINPKLLRAFGDKGARKLSDKDWLQHICEGSNKTKVEYCENSENFLMKIRAIQGHTGRNMTAPELVGHVTIPYYWKEFVFH